MSGRPTGRPLVVLRIAGAVPIIGAMSVEAVLTRIQEIRMGLDPQAAPPPATGAQSFAGQLGSATATLAGAPGGGVALPPSAPALSGLAGPQGATTGQSMVALAEGEVGQAEQPPGSNDSPRIAQYRSATAGAGVGPWCAYFTSWLAQQSGAPLGESGQGFGSVSALYGWAQRTGRAVPAGPGAVPQAGDLVVWGGEHVGVVESVGADGSVHTIEGNSSNAVTRRTYGPDAGGATGYVRV
jgi:hypothetical protein